MIWSKYQTAVFDFLGNQIENGFVEAVAGSGKTTVIVKCIEDVPFDKTVLAVAFGREIKKTLEGKLSGLPNVTIKTLNGFGYGACRAAIRRYIKIKDTKVQDTLFYDVFGGKNASDGQKDLYYKSRYLISKIIAIWKADMCWFPTQNDMLSVMERFNLDLPKKTTEEQIFSLLETTFLACMKKTATMDYDDQIAMPLYHGWPLDSYDMVFVDEAQDLTPAQIELTRRAFTGRAIYVGDPRQAIYQFRGADHKATANIIESMQCKLLPLSICYRCSKAVVRAAQKIVPEIEYHDDAPEGSEQVILEAEFKKIVKEGDLILCRCTAPLVQTCLEFIREERKATIKGREIGAQLIETIEKVADGVNDIETFNLQLESYVRDQEEKLTRSKRESALMALSDTHDTIICLYERCDTVSQMIALISKIFSDDVQGIMLMTIHKSKGLEEKNVFIIAPHLIPHKMAVTEEAQLAEENLAYVAITRAKLNIYYVGGNLSILEK